MEHFALSLEVFPGWVLQALVILGLFEAARLLAYIVVALSRELRRQVIHTCVALASVRAEYRSWLMVAVRLRRSVRRFAARQRRQAETREDNVTEANVK
jgi:hypothetical protein